MKSVAVDVERNLRAGRFQLKPWVFSGQNGRRECSEEPEEKLDKTEGRCLTLPNQMSGEDNKALGLGYVVEENKLYVTNSINFLRRKKMRLGQNLLHKQVRSQTPNALMRM